MESRSHYGNQVGTSRSVITFTVVCTIRDKATIMKYGVREPPSNSTHAAKVSRSKDSLPIYLSVCVCARACAFVVQLCMCGVCIHGGGGIDIF